MPPAPRPLGLRLIIAYKVIKAPAMLALALWLTLNPARASGLAEWTAQELSASGVLLSRVGAWILAHLSARAVTEATLVAWADGLSTALEATLLLLGKAWGEWLVVGGLSVLLPVEVASWIRRPSPTKPIVLAVNAAVVIYLAWRRLRHQPAPRDPE